MDPSPVTPQGCGKDCAYEHLPWEHIKGNKTVGIYLILELVLLKRQVLTLEMPLTAPAIPSVVHAVELDRVSPGNFPPELLTQSNRVRIVFRQTRPGPSLLVCFVISAA